MNEEVLTANDVWLWIAQLPTATYAAVAAALLALLAAVGYARWQRNLQRDQERAERRRIAERDLELRREVYLPAAEALARAQEFLAKYPGLELGRDEGRAVVDYIVGALGKVHMVGSERVIKSTLAVSTEFTNAFVGLSAKRRPMEELEQEMEHIDRRVSHWAVERDQLLANLSRMASDGLEESGGLWSDWNLRFDKLHREISSALDQRGERLRERNRLRRLLAVEAAQASLRIAKLAVPAYVALRQELALPLDEDEYRRLAQRSIGEIERRIEELEKKRPQPRAARAPTAEQKKKQQDAEAPEKRLKMALRRG